MNKEAALKQRIRELEHVEKALQESEKEARRLAQENDLVAEIGRIISSTLNLDEVYEHFAEKVRQIIPFDSIQINIVNAKDKTRTIRYNSGVQVEGRNIGDVVPLGGSVTERIVATQAGLLVNATNNEELLSRYPGIAYSVTWL